MTDSDITIDAIYAWVVTDPTDERGQEGIPAMLDMHSRFWLPMVGGDMARIESLRPQVQSLADEMGQPIRLLKFSVREELEVLLPTPVAST